MKNKLLFLGLLCLSFNFFACSEHVAGTATDTENTIAGVVRLSDSSVAVGASVRMLAFKTASSEGYTYLETSTDSSGAFFFDSTLADTVNLEFRYRRSDSSVVESRVLRGLAVFKKSLNVDVRLQKTAYVRGYLAYNTDSLFLVGSHFSVDMDSTTFGDDVVAPGVFFFPVDAGNFNLVVKPADSYVVQRLLAMGYADSVVMRKVPVIISAGDTLDLGYLRWTLSSYESTICRILSGVVVDVQGKPVKGASVHIVTDLYGFGVSDSTAFITQAVSNSNGIWYAAAPSLDSIEGEFRVEFRGKDSAGAILAGVSDYISSESLASLQDTLLLDSVSLLKSSSFLGKIFLVLGMQNSTSSKDTLCMAYGIKVGFKGTSSFARTSSCNLVTMQNLAPGAQELIYYSSDEMAVSNLKKGVFDPEDYVRSVSVYLPEGDTLKNQGFTYMPPTASSY
ncbi:MAG: hypothetical protein M0P13_01145 [Fibrobacteraceae bacterium]|nr:hypothetical protein [Fibrobacteraceae bacterium]